MFGSEKRMIRNLGILAMFLAVGCFFAQAQNITGKWKGHFITPVGINRYVYEFHVNGTTLTGTTNSSDTGKSVVNDGKITGNTFTFVEPSHYNGMHITVRYKGTILNNNKIKLERWFYTFPPDTFTITRAK